MHNPEQKHHFILKQTREGSSISGSQSVVTLYLELYFPPSYSTNKAKLSVSRS